VIVIVGGLELHKHQVNGASGRDEKEDFHGRVISGDEVGEQVQVAGDEDDSEEGLGPT